MQDSKIHTNCRKNFVVIIIPQTDKENYVLSYQNRVIYMDDGKYDSVQNLFYRLLYNNTYLLTPWCRVLLEKLTGLQLVKKFLAFYGTRMFITALKSVRHLSLSCASPIQSNPHTHLPPPGDPS